MIDPLSDVVGMLQPTARFSKLLECTGRWRIQRDGAGAPFYAAVLDGCCRLSVGGRPAMVLQEGDFVLVPALHALVHTSVHTDGGRVSTLPVRIGTGHMRVGPATGAVALRMQIGHCQFAAPDADLLVPLLPDVVHVRGAPRLTALVRLVGDEARAQRPARDVVLERLLELLLIEALRSHGGRLDGQGLARGLADERLGDALRALHARPAHPWTVAALAGEAALSRSAFSARFTRLVGVAPMTYLLTWRMALAKRLLRGRDLTLEQVAVRVGYATGNTFSVAFARHVGVAPARYGRGSAE